MADWHGGRFWNSGPLLPCEWIWSDPLHLFLNLFNVAFDESIDFFLQHEFVTCESKELIADCDRIGREMNQLLAGAHITARFGTDERKAFCGNGMRALMEHPSVLPDLLALVRPLYQRMEPLSFAADAAKARKEQAKLEERLAKEVGGEGRKKKAVRVVADDFDATPGISLASAKRVRKQQAAVEVAVAKTRTFDKQFEAHVAAMQQAVEGNYSWRVVNMLNALVEFYEFVHAKQWLADALEANASAGWGVVESGKGGMGRGPAVCAAVEKRKIDCKERSLLVARDIVAAVGTAREQTYVHDLVYGLHRIFEVVLHPLLAGMQGCEHVNKKMKQILVGQCTAACNNRYDSSGKRLLGDVAQVATAVVVSSHIVDTRAEDCPQDMYGQRMFGKLGWGKQSTLEHSKKRDHKVFVAGSVAGLNALKAGTHSPAPTSVASPGTMSELLANPPRKRRYVPKPTPLRPDFLEPGPSETSL